MQDREPLSGGVRSQQELRPGDGGGGGRRRRRPHKTSDQGNRKNTHTHTRRDIQRSRTPTPQEGHRRSKGGHDGGRRGDGDGPGVCVCSSWTWACVWCAAPPSVCVRVCVSAVSVENEEDTDHQSSPAEDCSSQAPPIYQLTSANPPFAPPSPPTPQATPPPPPPAPPAPPCRPVSHLPGTSRPWSQSMALYSHRWCRQRSDLAAIRINCNIWSRRWWRWYGSTTSRGPSSSPSMPRSSTCPTTTRS